jgi:hypothetical protein
MSSKLVFCNDVQKRGQIGTANTAKYFIRLRKKGIQYDYLNLVDSLEHVFWFTSTLHAAMFRGTPIKAFIGYFLFV